MSRQQSNRSRHSRSTRNKKRKHSNNHSYNNNNNNNNNHSHHYSPPPRHRHKYNKNNNNINIPNNNNNNSKPNHNDQNHQNQTQTQTYTNNNHCKIKNGEYEYNDNIYLHNNRYHNYYYKPVIVANPSPNPNINMNPNMNMGLNMNMNMNLNLNPNMNMNMNVNQKIAMQSTTSPVSSYSSASCSVSNQIPSNMDLFGGYDDISISANITDDSFDILPGNTMSNNNQVICNNNHMVNGGNMMGNGGSNMMYNNNTYYGHPAMYQYHPQPQPQNNNMNCVPAPPPPPSQHVVNDPYSGSYYVSIDVECSAIGYGHFDSSPCRIAMIDYSGNVLFDEIISVNGMIDPLTEFTGLTASDIQTHGKDIKYVLNKLHQILINFQMKYKYGVTIIGQSLTNDIVWSKLIKGIHYNRLIDIALLYRTKTYDRYYYYSLRQEAYLILNKRMNDKYHDPTEDAKISIELYKFYINNSNSTIESYKNKLKKMRIMKLFPDFKVISKFKQCCSMYNPIYCKCGQQTTKNIEDVEYFRNLFEKYKNHPVLQCSW